MKFKNNIHWFINYKAQKKQAWAEWYSIGRYKWTIDLKYMYNTLRIVK